MPLCPCVTIERVLYRTNPQFRHMPHTDDVNKEHYFDFKSEKGKSPERFKG